MEILYDCMSARHSVHTLVPCGNDLFGLIVTM